jgi:hypothetical protein
MINIVKNIFIVSFMSLMLIVPASVHAFDDPFAKACEGSEDAKNSSLCKEKASVDPDPIYGSNGIINKIANIIAAVAGLAAVIIIMLSGLKMIMSNGDSKKLSDSRNAIIYASVGLVVIAMARVIVGFIVGLI